MGISTKTSAICGLIVLLLLLINGLIFLGLESSLVESIFKEYAANVSEALVTQGMLQKEKVDSHSKHCFHGFQPRLTGQPPRRRLAGPDR